MFEILWRLPSRRAGADSLGSWLPADTKPGYRGQNVKPGRSGRDIEEAFLLLTINSLCRTALTERAVKA